MVMEKPYAADIESESLKYNIISNFAHPFYWNLILYVYVCDDTAYLHRDILMEEYKAKHGHYPHVS